MILWSEIELIKVSIIVPVYNVEAYLRECLDSILNQTLKEVEIIIVDDGSTDNCKEIIQEYKKKYKNIITIYQENQGVSVARNRALHKANGEYIYYMDSDDYLELECLEQVYRKAKQDNLNIVIFRHYEIYEGNEYNIKTEVNIDIDFSKIYSGVEVADMVLNCKFLGTPWNKLFKRECLIKDNFEFEAGRYVQDWYPIFREIYSSNRIAFIDKPLYNYRIRKGSTTSKKGKKNIDDYNHAAMQIMKFSICNNLDYNSILKFKALSLKTIIKRFYDINVGDRQMYKKFKECNYQEALSNIKIIKIKNINIYTKLELIFWNVGIYHIFKYLENKLYKMTKLIHKS